MGGAFVYESDRTFSIFGYAMSHGLLLLRSGKSNEHANTRADVLFQDVRAMEIRTWFKGMRIEVEESLEFLKDQRSNPAQIIEPGNKIYSIRSSGWEGFVVAGLVSFVEDSGELFDPSSLVSAPPVKRWTLG